MSVETTLSQHRSIAVGLNVLFLVVIIVFGLFFLGAISRHHVEVGHVGFAMIWMCLKFEIPEFDDSS